MATFDSNYDDIRPAGSGNVLNVGEGQQYATPQEAYKASQAGDTILVHEGTYSFSGNEYYARYNPDAPILVSHDINIVGVGDVTFDIGDVAKGALVTEGNGVDADLYVENITFQGAHNRDFNGAGIRHQDGHLTVVNTEFINNQNAILGGGNAGDSATILDSTFHDNGHGDGKSHAVYINGGDTLTVDGSTFTGTNEGHHVKSLADYTVVRNSTLGDGNDTASMAIDVTAGGDVLVENNTIVESANSSNGNIFYYSDYRGETTGTIVIRDNHIRNEADKATLIGVDLTDRPSTGVVLENNTIEDPSGNLTLSASAYTSTKNTLNGSALPDGDFDPDWPVGSRDLPSGLGEVPMPMMEETWLADGGQYLMAGWGKATLTGTNGRDVLEARQKGTKTLEGGAGDDVYLPWGQANIVEEAGDGFDWVVQNSASNAYYMPANIEGFALHTADAYSGAVHGNDRDNTFVGATTGGNDFRGKAGNDMMYGGGAAGNTFYGGAGRDTYVLSGSKSTYTISAVEDNGQVKGFTIEYSDGGQDKLGADVEQIKFDDTTLETSTLSTAKDDSGDTTSDGSTGDTTDDPTSDTGDTTGDGSTGQTPDGDYAFLSEFPQTIAAPSAPVSSPLPLWSETASWVGANGTYQSAGWGAHTLEGTDARDVLEAQSKGLKTLIGGAGDDIYLAFGQNEIAESVNGGYDWVVKNATGWAYTMADNVEGLYLAAEAAYTKAVKGNETDNTFVGAYSGGNEFHGGAGDDVMYGGGNSGNTFRGGAGVDTYILDGSRNDYTVKASISNGTVVGYDIEYGSGGADHIGSDVEFVRFSDGTFDLVSQTWQESDPTTDGSNSGGSSTAQAVDDKSTTTYGRTTQIDVIANDTDVTSLTDVSAPAAGTAWIGDNGGLYYRPDAGVIGTDSFSYTAVGSDGAEVSADVNVQVEPEKIVSGELSSYGRQDKEGGVTLSADGAQIDLNGNTWQLSQFHYEVTPDTVLKFDFKVDQLGEIHGIGVDADGEWNNGNDLAFALAGSQTNVAGWDSFNFDYHGQANADWATVEIALGDHYQGQIKNLAFLNDHDVSDPTAAASFENLVMYEAETAQTETAETEAAGPLSDGGLIFDQFNFESYAGDQDVSGEVKVSTDGSQVELSGNGWKKTDIYYEVTDQTILSFEFKADTIGELHGVGVEQDDTWDNGNDVAFVVAGTQKDVGDRSSLNFDYHDDNPANWQRYEVALGDYVDGPASGLTFVNDDDQSGALPSSMFRNVELTEVV
jgi:hypothetical protein